MPVCDGCGARADDAHVRRRAERLAPSLRYRPTQIKVLVLDGCPPSRSEDGFYAATRERTGRSLLSRTYFDEIAKAAGIAVSPAVQEDSALVEFRRKGFYVAHSVECPCD